MITYADPRAYETIQRDIENSFYTHINKNKNENCNGQGNSFWLRKDLL